MRALTKLCQTVVELPGVFPSQKHLTLRAANVSILIHSHGVRGSNPSRAISKTLPHLSLPLFFFFTLLSNKHKQENNVFYWNRIGILCFSDCLAGQGPLPFRSRLSLITFLNRVVEWLFHVSALTNCSHNNCSSPINSWPLSNGWCRSSKSTGNCRTSCSFSYHFFLKENNYLDANCRCKWETCKVLDLNGTQFAFVGRELLHLDCISTEQVTSFAVIPLTYLADFVYFFFAIWF